MKGEIMEKEELKKIPEGAVRVDGYGRFVVGKKFMIHPEGKGEIAKLVSIEKHDSRHFFEFKVEETGASVIFNDEDAMTKVTEI